MTQILKENGLYYGIKDSISIGLASGLFGVVFGALAKIKGIGLGLASYMSVIMYAGASQVVTVKLWDVSHSHIFALILIVLVICIRYFLMSFSLYPHFKYLPKWKVYSALFLLMDENWALTLVKKREGKAGKYFLFNYFVGAGLLSYFLWIAGTILGELLAGYIDNLQSYGIEFVFTALFLGLLVSAWRGKRDILPCCVTLISAVITKTLIGGSWYIILGTLVGSLTGALYELHKQSNY